MKLIRVFPRKTNATPNDENVRFSTPTMFGLQTKSGSQWFGFGTPQCQHNNGSAIGVYGGGQHPNRRRPATIGVWGNAGGASNRDGLVQFGTQDRRDAMGIDWMTGKELSQAVPPAYSEWVGRACLATISTHFG